jgi:hypothetical protein
MAASKTALGALDRKCEAQRFRSKVDGFLPLSRHRATGTKYIYKDRADGGKELGRKGTLADKLGKTGKRADNCPKEDLDVKRFLGCGFSSFGFVSDFVPQFPMNLRPEQIAFGRN